MAFAALTTCARRPTNGPEADAAGASLAAASSASASPSAATALLRPTTTTGEAGPHPDPSTALLADGAVPTCRALRGPMQLPLRAPAALTRAANAVTAVLDDDGRPRVSSFATGPIPSVLGPTPPPREPVEGVASAVFRVPCAIAGDFAMCPDRNGAIHRTRLNGDGERTVASSRAGTRVAAADLGEGHAAVAYIASRKTSEGWVSEAWLEVDDDVPVRISEDGSGATAVDLAPRGGSLLAITVDSRTALTAMHARPVSYDHGVRLAEDVVVFVGGPGDRRTAAALEVPVVGPGWALLPIAKSTEEFGLAAVRLDDPPRVDEPVVWSLYPNGLDPAPVSSTSFGQRTWVARVRPQAPEAGAPRVLELGELSIDGEFLARAVLPASDSPTDVSLMTDAVGALWIAWLDSSGSWIERLICR